MRKQHPRHGDRRFVSEFLWLPLTLNYETRWLERATWSQRYFESGRFPGWVDQDWADTAKETRDAG